MKNIHNLMIRTNDLWLELDDDICSSDSSPSISPSLRTPAIALPPPPPKSAPPFSQAAQYASSSNLCNGEVSLSNGGTPTMLRPEDSLLRPHDLEPNGKRVEIQTATSECRLQQSLSTPCPQDDQTSRKESEYRRFKSEGSSGGALPAGPEMDVAIDDLSPIADSRSTPPHRFNLIAQDSVVNGGPITKHSNTEQVLMMHTLKTKTSKYQSFIDKAFQNIMQATDEQIIEGCTIVAKVMTKAWMIPKVSHDLSFALCDYLREKMYLDALIRLFIGPTTCEPVRLACGRVLEECMSLNNREYIVNKGWLKKIVTMAMKLNKNAEQQRMSLSIMESMFKHSSSTSMKLIEYGVLDHIIITSKRAMDTPTTLRHAALGLANLTLYTCSEGKKKLIQKKLPEWLFLLVNQDDDLTRYYASLAICMLASIKEFESAVMKSDTLKLVEPFLLAHDATTFAGDHYKHSQGRPKEWLSRLLPMLKSMRREAKSMAAFHFAMEAAIKKDQNKLDVFQEIGAIQALKEVASSPDEVAAKFASEALTVIGEEVPYKLAQQVPNWTVKDVQYWVKKIGFEDYVDRFAKQMVDGDILLHLNEKELERDIGMSSGLHRKRFIRELESLKIAADYSAVDESNLDQLLMSLSPELSVYTYKMLSCGINRSLLGSLTDELMQTACGITNPIHRLKMTQAFQNAKHPDEVEVAVLSKQIDVFISYRRSTGNQLASLIKVLLQLKGYKVFIDVDKLYAGKFDSSLLKNIQAAKHFILVLTPNSLDRLLNDHNGDDWIHKELKCAFEYQKNIIPIFDQAFEFPQNEEQIPQDIRMITKYNGVKWVHDYQDACMGKVVRFIEGELNRTPSLPAPSQSNTHARRTVSGRFPTSQTSVRQASTTSHRTNGRAGDHPPSTPTFTPASSTDRNRRKHHTSVTTVYDRS
uniref:ADP-ribosyl cyclase/cyclic ADP-ribose hydrolase n=1 Tax=Haemonchus contortus TaxID=6289 RepID=A0A7I4YEU4_HAECO|nr:Sterile alpha motif SAM and Sterile alpha motif homology 2 and Toll-Interleukin receptor domain containing protein [Haemonchus contortus]